MAPFAPFTTEDIWQQLGKLSSVHHANYPVHNPEYIKEDEIEYPIQINGKVRAKIAFPANAGREEIEPAVLANERVAQWVADKTIRKFIYVPGRIINIVAN